MATLPELVRQRWPTLHGPGIVAVSGGADSVALFRALSSWINPLIVAHVNHRLRGSDSDADEQFVRDLADTLKLPCRITVYNVAEEAQRTGKNLEAIAREIRYAWFTQVALEANASWVATGHTADDQAETVLHRLLRGAGMQGLRGIARERELHPGVRLVRPLLAVSRADVQSYLTSLQQDWREDLSNRDPAFTRNRIRHELLPLLRTFNPIAGEVLGRLAEQAGEVCDDQLLAARQLLAEAEAPAVGELRIFRMAVLQASTASRVREMFRLLWEREDWPRQDMTFDHWKRLVAVSLGEETATDLPGGISARHRGSVMQVQKNQFP
jgi:tRNA(Ile)-lysidine synthase